MSLSIARLLVELKTLDNRINKIISSTNWVIYKTKNRNYGLTEEEFKKKTLAEHQSLNDLIKRRNAIKNAIVLSNSVINVQIGGQKMTVAQAIEYKQTIVYKKNLLEYFKQQRQQVIVESEAHRQRVQNKIDDNIKIICGKDNKPDANTIQTISDGISKGVPIDVFDPLDLEEQIKKLENEIEEFTANVDYVLSESNALTNVTINI
jgi:hypothetical protein